MYDLTAPQLVLRLAGMALLIAVQGAAVALAAILLGDDGPRHDGRRTANPLAHLDLIGLVGGIVFSIGWTKPVRVDAEHLRGGRAGLVAVVLASFVAVLGLVLLLQWLRHLVLPLLSDTPAQTFFAFVDVTSVLGLWMALVNLLPLPPFVGVHLLGALAPRRDWSRLQIPAGLAVLALAPAGLGQLLAPAERALAALLLG